MALKWWCPSCWADLAGPEERCRCGFDPAEYRPDYVERLIATLRHPIAERATHAAALLGQIGDPRAVGPLTGALSSSDPYLQAEAATALGRIGDPAAAPALARVLEEGSAPARSAAARALAALRRNGDERRAGR